MRQLDQVIHVAQRKGWQARRAAGSWLLRRSDLSGPVELSLSTHWLALRYQLLSGASPWPGRQLPSSEQVSLYRAVLLRNERMYMAKICLDLHGYPALCVEVPAAGLGPLLISRALEAIPRYKLRLPASWKPATDDSELVAMAPEHPTRLYAPDHSTAGLPEHLLYDYVRMVEPYGWAVRTTPRGPYWHFGYKNRLRLYEAYAVITRAWCSFRVPVLLEPRASVLGAPTAAAAACLEYLLRLSDTWHVAKPGVDEHGQVLLLLEVPTEALTPELFRAVTRTIGTYLDRYGQEIQIMATLDQDQPLAEALLRARATPPVAAAI